MPAHTHNHFTALLDFVPEYPGNANLVFSAYRPYYREVESANNCIESLVIIFTVCDNDVKTVSQYLIDLTTHRGFDEYDELFR